MWRQLVQMTMKTLVHTFFKEYVLVGLLRIFCFHQCQCQNCGTKACTQCCKLQGPRLPVAMFFTWTRNVWTLTMRHHDIFLLMRDFYCFCPFVTFLRRIVGGNFQFQHHTSITYHRVSMRIGNGSHQSRLKMHWKSWVVWWSFSI